MQPLFLAKFERGIQQTLYIKENYWANKILLLHGHIKQDIPVGLCIVPSCKTQHPRRNVKDAAH